MSFTTPILLIAWRRPHTLKQVIDAIRLVRPLRVFVACDGPNLSRPGESLHVAETRSVIEHNIDWECSIQRLYSETNLGCKIGVSNAISWFFEQVNEGIILEDDCVPLPSFFTYCATLLKRYRNDSRVWCISGSNFQGGQWRGDGSYYFSRYNHCWGWASWKRCWEHYDGDMRKWSTLQKSGLLESIFDDPVEVRYWSRIWQRLIEEHHPNTWDYQWTLTCMINGGLTALPNYNLVRNIGFGLDATHTVSSRIAQTQTKDLPNFCAPSFILRDPMADRYSFNHWFGGRWLRFPWSWIRTPARLINYWSSHYTRGITSIIKRQRHGANLKREGNLAHARNPRNH